MSIVITSTEIALILLISIFIIFLLIFFSVRMAISNKRIQINEERFRATLMHIGNVLFSNILEADITNDILLGENCVALTKMLGIPINSSYSKTIDAISKKMTKPEFAEEYREKLSIENLMNIYINKKDKFEFECIERSDGINYCWIRIHIYIFKSEITNTVRIISYVKNIDEEKQKLENLKKAAEMDLLTNTYNKISFRNAVTKILQSEYSQTHTLMMIDIDDFKNINDTYGHSKGDMILTKIAEKLKNIVRRNDLVGRAGGDEFVILFNGTSDRVVIENKMNQLYKEIGSISDEVEENIFVGISIGIITLSTQDDFEKVYHCADMALYGAKHKGKNQYVIYEKNYADID